MDKKHAEKTIMYFRTNLLPKDSDVNYSIEDKTLRFKVSKELYNNLTENLEKSGFKFSVNPQDRKMELTFPQFNGKSLLKTKFFDFEIFFVEPTALKTYENINSKDTKVKNIQTWTEFFDSIEPEYGNLFKKIVDGIPIAVHKNEYGKVIAKKSYFLDKVEGLFERKEKFVKDEWVITYQPITRNLYQVFRMFFKFFEAVPLNELTDYEKFKEIVSKTKYKTYLSQ